MPRAPRARRTQRTRSAQSPPRPTGACGGAGGARASEKKVRAGDKRARARERVTRTGSALLKAALTPHFSARCKEGAAKNGNFADAVRYIVSGASGGAGAGGAAGAGLQHAQVIIAWLLLDDRAFLSTVSPALPQGQQDLYDVALQAYFSSFH